MPLFHINSFARAIAAGLFGVMALMPGKQAEAATVGTELQLMIDVSGSISAAEYRFQLDIYEQAFQRIRAGEASGTLDLGSFAVQLSVWSGANDQAPLTPWLEIADDADFAQLLGRISAAKTAPPPVFSGNTSVAGALEFAVNSFTGNGFDSARQVIDISTDQIPNETVVALETGEDPPELDRLGDELREQRDLALMPFTDTGPPFFATIGGDIDQINVLLIGADAATETFYTDNLVGPDGEGFLVSLPILGVSGEFVSFVSSGLASKIAAEIAGTQPGDVPALPLATVPLPAGLWLMLGGLGLLGTFARARPA